MKRLTMEEMEAALTEAGIPYEPWEWTEEDRRRVESVFEAEASAKGRNPDLPPDESCCENGHRLRWFSDCEGFGVYRPGEFIPEMMGRLRGTDWRELGTCPVCGGAVHTLA